MPFAADAVDQYIAALRDPDALHCSFACYRALDETMAQNAARAERRLSMPVLAIAGAGWLGDLVGETMRAVADDVDSVVIPDCGHYPAEEAPDAVGEALARFLAD